MSQRGNFEQVGVEAVVRGFDAYVRQMKELVSQTQKTGQQLSGASTNANQFGKSLDISAGSVLKFGAAIAGAQLGLQAVRGAFSNTIGAAISFESSFAGVRKTVDATEEEFAALAQGFRDLAKEIPVNVNELNAIGEAAGQLGIRKEDILEFTETVAQLSATTSLTSDQAATDLARLANVVGFTADEFDNVASVIVALGNAGASTEPEILAFAERIAGAGKIAGLTIDEILAIGEAMSSVGVEAEAGGTAVQKVLLQITEAVNTSNDDLEIFARVAGLSAQQFAQAWQQDAGNAFALFVEGLGRAGTDAFNILDELDLKDQRLIRSFLSLSGAGDLLRNSLNNASTAMQSTAAIDTEFAKRQETTAAQLQILQNRLADVGISVGQVLLPAINDAIGAGIGFSDNLGVILPLVQTLADVIPSLTTALLAMGAAIAAIKLAQFAAALPSVVRGLGTTNLAIIGITASIAALDLALRETTGIGLVDRLLGNAGEIRAAADAADLFRNALFNIEDPAQRLQVALAELNKVAELPGIQTGREALFANERAFAQHSAIVAEGARVLQDNGASATQLRDAYRGLSEDLQKVFLDSLGLTEVTLETAAAIEQGRTATDGWQGSLGLLSEAVEETGASTEESQSALEEYVAALNEGEGAAKLFDEALAGLTASLNETNPAVIDLKAQSAVLAAEIAQLEAKIGDLTVAEEERLETLKDQKEAVDATIDAYGAEEAAIGPLIDEIQRLTGVSDEQAFHLVENLKGVTDSGEELRGILDQIQLALDSQDASQAIDEINRLRSEFTPEQWDAVVSILGPALLDKIRTGLAEGPSRAALISEFQSLGLNAADAFALGIELSIPNAVLAAEELANAGSQSLRDSMEIQSPSRVWAEIGEQSGQGLIEGILSQRVPFIQAAVAIVEEAADAATRAAASYTSPSGPAGTLPGYAQDVYDRDFPDDSSRRLFSEGTYQTQIGGRSFNTRFTPDGRAYIELDNGSWQSAGNLNLDYGGSQGSTTIEDLIQRGVIRPAKWGEDYVPRDGMLYQLHRGEAVIPAASNPYAGFLPAMMQSAAGGTSIVFDFSGATLTGDMAENESMMRRIVDDVLTDNLRRQAYLHGVGR